LGAAKNIILRAIDAPTANAVVKRFHYSGKVVNNSQLHIGVFYRGRLEGAMQFGPSLDKRKLQGLVEGTPWNGFIELNRMAFSDTLPRNSESRALGIALWMLRSHAPHLQWVVTFADGAQCGDGTIYRAAGFVLTSVKRNDQAWLLPDGFAFTRMSATDTRRPCSAKIVSRASMTMQGANGAGAQRRDLESAGILRNTGAASMRSLISAGARPIPGHQLRYLYFLDPTARERLTVPILPFSEIERRGAGMYRGKPRAGSSASGTSGDQPGRGGATPTPALSWKQDEIQDS
jgi:hypothetical protein